MVQTMKAEKMTFCIPWVELLDLKNEKPMNKPAAVPRVHLARMYWGMRQYCWNTL
jgi:hypothetical protein